MSMFEAIVGGPEREEVMRDTWGHMDAAPHVEHTGVIVFAGGHYAGEQVVLSLAFDDDTAGDGPWFYQHVHKWLCGQNTEPGTCYRWTGTYRHDGNDEFEFTGDITPFR